MKYIKEAASLIAIGLLIASGFRVAEYVIPDPEIRVIFCSATEDNKIGPCMSLKDIQAAKASKEQK